MMVTMTSVAVHFDRCATHTHSVLRRAATMTTKIKALLRIKVVNVTSVPSKVCKDGSEVCIG